MMNKERINENLRSGLRRLMAEDSEVIVLGEDVDEPYGGAFKITKGLGDEFTGRVLATPISEEGFVNMASGMALMGLKPIVDMMFSDFAALAFDPLLNFASKSVTMYGKRLELAMIVRCANGGYRGYGATHSQSMQKYFIGIPNLSVYELSPFHDNYAVLQRMLAEKQPCLFFEEKMLYSQAMYRDGTVSRLYGYTFTGEGDNWALAAVDEDSAADVLILCPGGLSAMCVAAAERLLLEEEIEVRIAVPSKLYPCRAGEILGEALRAGKVLIVEEGTGGGSWGESVAVQLYPHVLRKPDGAVKLLHSRDSIIPAAVQHEQRVLVGEQEIYNSVLELVRQPRLTR